MGQINIKDDAFIEDARRLATLLGTSVTGALREAVRDRLEREDARREAEVQARFEAIMEISRRAAALIPPHLRTSDHSDFYDENGRPK